MSIDSRRHQYGKVFGHWQLKEYLGSGSNGKSAVFRLEHIESAGVESALKVISLIEERGRFENLPPSRIEDYKYARQQCSEKAAREVLLMNDLQGNTNIVDYLDHTFVDWSDETGFGRDMLIRMEKLSDLRAQINAGKQFTREEILKIGMDIGNALILCHRKGIIHRDIKPENIFVNKDGNYKLGDFGISRIIRNTSSVFASTGVGTPQYWAPEQISGEYDTRVDLYSLGLVLYELSNQNRLPFAASSYIQETDIHRRMLGEPLPVPSSADPGLAQLILKACAHNASDRYRTAEEMLAALQKLNGGTAADGYQTIPAQSTVTGSVYSTIPAHSATNMDAYSTVPARQTEQPNGYSTMPAQSIPKADVYSTVPARQAAQADSYSTMPAQSASKADAYSTVYARQTEQPNGYSTMPAAPQSPSPFHTDRERKSSKRKKILLAAIAAAALSVGALVLNPFGCKEHDWAEATCIKPRECIKCGETEGQPLAHSWKAATCTQPSVCEFCEAASGEALGHTWKAATCTQPSVCEACGAVSGEALGHQWIPATDYTPKTCSACGQQEGEPLLKENAYAAYNVGNSFYFGAYEQDGKQNNGAEPIEWRVLAKESDRILVISEYALECMQFHSRNTAVTWENSDLRKRLNSDFYDSAFSKDEKALILLSEVTAEQNPWYSIDPGADTLDYIFIPSISEMKQYFDSNSDRRCPATFYAIQKGAHAPADQSYCTWWLLRNPGDAGDKVANVNTDGVIDYIGSRVESVVGAVRIMMWIKTAERN